ncbi:MAG: hypothetical protein J6K31_12180 [Parabacteroides sp.]|nr:hypothetical protein [Parabacteroides sp.]
MDFAFSYFAHAHAYEHCAEISIDDLYTVVQRGRKVINRKTLDLKALTEEARVSLEEGDLKDYQRKKEYGIPAITPHAFFPAGEQKIQNILFPVL